MCFDVQKLIGEVSVNNKKCKTIQFFSIVICTLCLKKVKTAMATSHGKVEGEKMTNQGVEEE